MNRKNGYRHELKYEIDYAKYLYLRKRLQPVMKTDPYASADGQYRIRSIYFDNIQDKALREKINGMMRREKFRIRYYNDDFSHIKLEKKMKYDQLCKKSSASLTESECNRLLAGDVSWMLEHPSDLLRELYGKMKYELLKPRITVSYIREAYVCKAGNVRITFDFDIRTSLYHTPHLETDFCDISAVDTPQTVVLEIKYDAFLPDLIAHLVQIEGVYRQSFSKYGICRRFG